MYCIAISVLAQIVLIVVLSDDFAIRPHLAGLDIRLADVATFCLATVQLMMDLLSDIKYDRRI